MRTITRAVLAAAAAAALTLGGSVAASAAPAIPLNNGQETPGAQGGAHGFFSYVIDGDELCYWLEVERLSAPAVAAHIHVGPRNVAGPVVVPLVVPAETDFEVSDCTTADEGVLAAISADPGAYYVNVHTPTYPPGEVRGQLK
ncbi:CHRD domain-containing protein [Microbacter sp. GSS18]|nr:CHRD domain-containing protein [Microbacter sp. GSS18]